MFSTRSFIDIAIKVLCQLIKEDERFAELDISIIEQELLKKAEGNKALVDDSNLLYSWMERRLKACADARSKEGRGMYELLCIDIFSEFLKPVSSILQGIDTSKRKRKARESWWTELFKPRPTSMEVIEAIFDNVFTQEELDSMLSEEEKQSGSENVGLKYLFISRSEKMIPKYSIEKSVELAKEIVDPWRNQLLSARSYLFENLSLNLFHC